MKWSRRPSCSFLTSLAAVTTTAPATHSSSASVSVSAFCVRRGRKIISFSTKTPSNDGEAETSSQPPRLTTTATTIVPSPYFTYTLGIASTVTVTSSSNSTVSDNTLYVPFTSFCNTRTLPQIRGPNFRLPPNVVAALCRVRDEEICSITSTIAGSSSTICGSETGDRKSVV